MRTRLRQGTHRSPRCVVRVIAALTGLIPTSAAAKPPVEPAPVEATPRSVPIHSSYQTWLAFTAVGPVIEPLLTFVDIIGGFQPDMAPSAFVVRPALGVRLPLGFSVFAGYSYASLWNDVLQRSEEHTAFQQVGYLAPLGDVHLFARVRGEERFRPGSEVGYRLRLLVQLNVPFWHRSPLDAVIAEELFLGLNQPASFQPALLDQDQYYFGVGWTVDPHFRAEVGYQGAVAPRTDEIAVAHCLSISTTAGW
ncbi:MAG: DUF2490 domain-containing protein [Polyangiaceae bacterium]